MASVTNNIFQAGEQVRVSGNYEVVGVNLATTKGKKEQALRTLQKGEFFPNYEGLEVCWHFVTSDRRRDTERTTL